MDPVARFVGALAANATVSGNETLVLQPPGECSGDAGQASVDEVLVAVGTVLVILASFVSCFGVNLQKWAHNIEAGLAPEHRTGMLRSWRWWAGIGCMVLGSILDVIALLWVPLSRVAALGAGTIVANIIITPLFLKETVTRHDVFGCAVTVVGTALACYFGVSGEKKVSSSCLIVFFGEGLFLGYLSLLLMLLITLFYLTEGFRRMASRLVAAGHLGGPGQPADLETTWFYTHADCLAPLAAAEPLYPFVTRFGPQFYPAVHAVFGGMCGALSVMFAKAVLKCFEAAVGGDDVGMNIIYLLVFLLPCAFFLWCQLRYLNVALRIYCDAVFVLPVYQAVWICTGVASGLVYYQEYKSIKGLNIAMFTTGLVGVLVGLGILARRSRKKDCPSVAALDPEVLNVVPRPCDPAAADADSLSQLSWTSPLSLGGVVLIRETSDGTRGGSTGSGVESHGHASNDDEGCTADAERRASMPDEKALFGAA